MIVRIVAVALWLAPAASYLPPPNRQYLVNREISAAATRKVLRPVRAWRSKLPKGRWLLEYADLRPLDQGSIESQREPSLPEPSLHALVRMCLRDATLAVRAVFLATNIVFFSVGGLLAGGNTPLLALQMELAGCGSVWYHWNQVCYGYTNHPAVQLAMLVDYLFAVPTALRFVQMVTQLGVDVPQGALACAAGAAATLAAGWVWDGPRQYMVLHGLWHILGAAAIYQVALAVQ